MHNKEKGNKYEDLAAAYLENHGMHILERNFRCRQGEIDIIGLHEECLVFAEVKYRKTNTSGTPEEAVGERKQCKICYASDYYRLFHPNLNKKQVRYDVIAILGEQLTWYQNAFPYKKGGF